jgi:FkbM family methyltransferase
MKLQAALARLGVSLHRWPTPGSIEKALDLFFRKYAVDCVLDVGANEGQYAHMLRRIGYRGWIVSFDPVPENVAILEASARQDPRWLVHGVALGSQEGSAPFHVSRGTDMSSFLTANEYAVGAYPQIAEAATVSVPVCRLDALFDGLVPDMTGRRVFLKCDTQGYDLEVLRGASGCLPALVGLQVELSLKPLYEGMPDLHEVLAALHAAGFEPVAMVPVGTDPSGALVEVDCVAQRRA